MHHGKHSSPATDVYTDCLMIGGLEEVSLQIDLRNAHRPGDFWLYCLQGLSVEVARIQVAELYVNLTCPIEIVDPLPVVLPSLETKQGHRLAAVTRGALQADLAVPRLHVLFPSENLRLLGRILPAPLCTLYQAQIHPIVSDPLLALTEAVVAILNPPQAECRIAPNSCPTVESRRNPSNQHLASMTHRVPPVL